MHFPEEYRFLVWSDVAECLGSLDGVTPPMDLAGYLWPPEGSARIVRLLVGMLTDATRRLTWAQHPALFQVVVSHVAHYLLDARAPLAADALARAALLSDVVLGAEPVTVCAVLAYLDQDHPPLQPRQPDDAKDDDDQAWQPAGPPLTSSGRPGSAVLALVRVLLATPTASHDGGQVRRVLQGLGLDVDQI